MQSVLCTYDIRDDLNLPNPSPVLRRYGIRINLSCWIFPQALVPTDYLCELQSKGADVHLLQFAESDWAKIVKMAQASLDKIANDLVKDVRQRCAKAKDVVDRMTAYLAIPDPWPGQNPEGDAANMKAYADRLRAYRKWRSTLNKGRRELCAAQQCAVGFGISAEVSEALAGLQSVLASELSLALAAKETIEKEIVPQEQVA